MGVNKRLIGAGAAGGAFVNNENFRVVTYTGNGGTQSITGVVRKQYSNLRWESRRILCRPCFELQQVGS